MRTDRRQHERKPSCLPIWVADDEVGFCGQGQAVNISEGGVYVLVVAESARLEGRDVAVTIGTPCSDPGGSDVHRCQARALVIRTEEVGYGTGLALKFTDALRPLHPQHQMMPS